MTTEDRLSIVLAASLILGGGLSYYFWDETRDLRSRLAERDKEMAAKAPELKNQLDLGPGERIKVIALPSKMLNSEKDECVIYTNESIGAVEMRCRDWMGTWGTK